MASRILFPGQVYNRLTTIRQTSKGKHAKWECLCSCGQRVEVVGDSLRSGNTKSCGCLKSDIIHTLKFQHGRQPIKLWWVWCGMRHRCYMLKNKDYKYYGALGVTVCTEWMDYINFRAWALKSGYAEGMSIDRIDSCGNYQPSNCRWISIQDQQKNRRNQIAITAFGETKNLYYWQCDSRCKVSRGTIQKRLRDGWTAEHAISVPASGTYGY